MRRTLALVLVVLAAGSSAAAAAPRADAVQSLRMLDARRGFALGGTYPRYRLLRTGDGGRSWADITPDRGRSRPVTAPSVVGGTLLIVTQLRAHVFQVLRSADGGRTWRRSLPVRYARAYAAWSPVGPDAQHLFLALDEGAAAGSQGEALFASGDGGHTWRFRTTTTFARVVPGRLPFGCDKNGVGFATPTRGFAGGNCAGGRPFLYRSGDGGRRWHFAPLPGLGSCQCDVSAPTFFSPRAVALTVFGAYEATGYRPVGRVYWTTDGGDHWRPSRAGFGRPTLAVAVAPATAWAITAPPGHLRGPFNRLWRTADSGRTWRVSTVPFDAQNYRLDVVNAQVAFAYPTVGGAAALVRTTDGGRSWHRVRP
jgi:photosystem II stability/assembly factor-like uncharacterized protein